MSFSGVQSLVWAAKITREGRQLYRVNITGHYCAYSGHDHSVGHFPFAEYLADETGAMIAGNSDGLANALLKLKWRPSHTDAANPAASHLFIVNPLSGQSFAKLFSTHPSITDRVNG